MELLPGGLSPTLHNAVVWLGASLPFRRVQAFVAMVGRVTVSASTVRRVTEQAGAGLVAVEAAHVRTLEQTLPAVSPRARRLQLSVDGVMVPVRGGEWREVKTAAIGELAGTPAGKTTQLSYVSRLQNIEHFAWLATGELHRRGVFAAEQVVAVADGAAWCQTFVDYHCPTAVRILDFPHAVEHLNQAAQACFGPGSEPARAWLHRQHQSLRSADPQRVVDAVAALPVEQAPDRGQAREVRDQVHAYLQARLSQMTYAAFMAQGFPVASGIVESANKLVVEARMKGPGMHWAEGSVDGMLALRCALCSNRWEQVWPQISRHRRHASQRSRPRPPLAAPLPSPVRPPRPLAPAPASPRTPTIINGKPTKDHPWKQSMLPARRPAATIPKN